MTFQRVIRLTSIPLMLAWLWSATASAQGLLRDADIEYSLKQVAGPVLQAAGLNAARVKILVVNENTLNAFVVGHDAIFINYGLINRMSSAAMLQAVIAHEAAHITNGHITRRMTNMKSARTAAGLGIALAAAAAASGNGRAAGAIALGTSSSAQRLFFAHTRAEEASADQSAIRILKAANVPPTALKDVLEIFRGQEALSPGRQDPYARSHPLSRDRVRAVDGYIAAYGTSGQVNQTAEYWFARAQGKLSAYTRNSKWTLRRLDDTPYKDVRLLREAVAEHRQSRTKRALRAIDAAISLRPNDPFLLDMRGQILIETRQFTTAEATYARAVRFAPNDALILAGYGRALMANGKTKQALGVLEKARTRDFRDGSMLRDLSVAYARTGQTGMAALVTAERYALSGRLDDAGIHAKRASGLLLNGSGPWQRAQDILIASERAEKRR